ncbi:unnamed protein product [Paramecium pentaurelia]|uniref:UBA domain-containing protein n=1 Tax=Paramecium pentaurelia TaxID=43138 RepID=A0A8S1X2Z2_9CILI|nr:unnamed protein product [Paramecium pentaurelia]
MNIKEQKAIHKLIKAGYLEQHNQLIAQGITNPWFNYHHLNKNNGDIHKVIFSYNENQNKKEEKRQRALKTIENMGWLHKNQELLEKGFPQIKKNLKVLLKTNGDVEKSISILSKKKYMKFDKPIELIMQELGFTVQFEKLKEMGYTNEKKIAKLLFKFEGNLEPILDKFLKIKNKDNVYSIKKPIEKHKPKKFSQDYQQLKKNKAELKQKFAHLKGKNIHDKKTLKFLSIFNGDIESAIKWLNQIKPQAQSQGQMLLEQEVLAQQ